jgi:hypothetical protein
MFLYIYSGALVHERPCSRTNFPSKKVSDHEHASWQQRQAESISAGVSCWLTLAQYTSLLDLGLRTFRFTNGLQERIKFVNRGPTVVGTAWLAIYENWKNLQWNLDLSIRRHSFSRFYHAPSLVPNKVPYK